MKTTIVKLILSVFLLTIGFLSVKAQDVITKKDKTTINAKILEIGLDEIKYVPADNQTGPVMNIDKTEVFKI